jgi:Ca2+-binding RTX toxin-like protein
MPVVIGTNGDDVLDGSASNDLIIAGKGDDTIDGGDGHDLIFGGKGDDIIDGGDGNDVLLGGKGDDTISGGDGCDVLLGGKGDDILDGGADNDLIFGGKGDDTLIGGEGNDWLIGGRGNDLYDFTVGFGTDKIYGFRAGENTNDRILLRDTEVTTFAGMLALASNVGCNVEIAFANGDTIVLYGLSIADLHEDDFVFETTLSGLFTENADTVNFNTIAAGTYTEGSQYDGLGGADIVTLASTAAAAAAAGYVVGTAFNAGAGNDIVNGGALDDVVNGGAGNDVIIVGGGDNVVTGGTGDDVIGVTDGNNTLDGGAGNDFLNMNTLTADITVNLVTGTAVVSGGGTSTITGFEHVNAGSGNDTITGDALDNTLAGFAGNDTILGGDGNDNLNGGAGDDDLFGGDGNDTLIGGSGFNRLFAATGVDTIIGGDDGDQVLLEDLNGDTGDGGADFDVLIFNFASGVNIDLATGAASLVGGGGSGTFTNFEAVVSQGGGATGSGTNVRNSLTFNGGNNNIFALGGDDEIRVNGAGDAIDGGTGIDNLVFQTSDDVEVNLGAGTTSILGSAGTVTGVEMVTTGTGNDTIDGSAGNEVLSGGDGNDTINGAAGNDTLYGGDGNDRLFGGFGVETLYGDDGNDLLFINDLNGDFADGGDGIDFIQFNFAAGVNIDLVTGVASLVGGGGVGTFNNFEGGSTFGGGATVSGTDGVNNFLVNGGGNNISLLDGDDNVTVDGAGDHIDGGLGYDRTGFTTSADVTVDLVAGTTSILGTAGTIASIERISTGTGNDNITGTAADERIEVGTGANIVNAGDGTDLIFVFDGGDTIDGGSGLNDTLFVSTTQDVHIDRTSGQVSIGVDPLTNVTNIESFATFGGNDTLIGSADVDNLNSGAGNDTLTSGLVTAGLTDNLSGGEGNDTFILNGASSQVTTGTGTDTLEFIDFGSGASQFCQVFDFDQLAGDRIDVTDWGFTEADIQNGYIDLGVDSQVLIGNYNLLLRGIDNSEFDTGFFDFIV